MRRLFVFEINPRICTDLHNIAIITWYTIAKERKRENLKSSEKTACIQCAIKWWNYIHVGSSMIQVRCKARSNILFPHRIFQNLYAVFCVCDCMDVYKISKVTRRIGAICSIKYFRLFLFFPLCKQITFIYVYIRKDDKSIAV